MVHEQIILHIAVSVLCILIFSGYGETCLNKVVIFIILAKPLHGNE